MDRDRLDRFMERTNDLTEAVQKLLSTQEAITKSYEKKQDRLFEQVSELKDRIGNIESGLAEKEKHSEIQKLRELPYSSELETRFDKIEETLDNRLKEKLDKNTAYAIVGAFGFILTLIRIIMALAESGIFQ